MKKRDKCSKFGDWFKIEPKINQKQKVNFSTEDKKLN